MQSSELPAQKELTPSLPCIQFFDLLLTMNTPPIKVYKPDIETCRFHITSRAVLTITKVQFILNNHRKAGLLRSGELGNQVTSHYQRARSFPARLQRTRHKMPPVFRSYETKFYDLSFFIENLFSKF